MPRPFVTGLRILVSERVRKRNAGNASINVPFIDVLHSYELLFKAIRDAIG